MSARKLFVALLVFAALWALAAGGITRYATVRLRHVYAAQYPPGVGKSIADRACVTCHSPTLITQQAKDSTAWEKTLGQMVKWGVALTPAERDTLRGYLVAKFGPRVRPPE